MWQGRTFILGREYTAPTIVSTCTRGENSAATAPLPPELIFHRQAGRGDSRAGCSCKRSFGKLGSSPTDGVEQPVREAKGDATVTRIRQQETAHHNWLLGLRCTLRVTHRPSMNCTTVLIMSWFNEQRGRMVDSMGRPCDLVFSFFSFFPTRCFFFSN